MRLCRWIAVILVFAVEVRVKAAQSEPPKCLQARSGECSLLSTKVEMVTLQAAKFRLSPGSLLFRDIEGVWNLAKGTIRVETESPFTIKSQVGQVTLYAGTHWLQWRDERLWVYVLEGSETVKLNSSITVAHVVPQGFYNWYGLADYQGENTQGVPRALTSMVAKIIPGLSRLPDFNRIKQSEARTVGLSGDLFQDVAQGFENGAFSREQENLRVKRNRERFDLRLREMFRQKYLGPVDMDADQSDSAEPNKKIKD